MFHHKEKPIQRCLGYAHAWYGAGTAKKPLWLKNKRRRILKGKVKRGEGGGRGWKVYSTMVKILAFTLNKVLIWGRS